MTRPWDDASDEVRLVEVRASLKGKVWVTAVTARVFDEAFRKKGCIAIYALSDPRDDSVHYVGQSVHPGTRLVEHRTEGKNSHEHSVARNRWINSLLVAGVSPTLRILEEVPPVYADEVELAWIARFRAEGAPLCNSARQVRINLALDSELQAAVAKLARQLVSPKLSTKKRWLEAVRVAILETARRL